MEERQTALAPVKRIKPAIQRNIVKRAIVSLVAVRVTSVPLALEGRRGAVHPCMSAKIFGSAAIGWGSVSCSLSVTSGAALKIVPAVDGCSAWRMESVSSLESAWEMRTAEESDVASWGSVMISVRRMPTALVLAAASRASVQNLPVV